MTNYCQNRLEIEGPADDITAFAEKCLIDTGPPYIPGLFILNFHNIVPIPEGLDRDKIEQWETDTWGVSPDCVTYHGASLTDTSYTASFASPWGAPEGIIRAVARQFPRLAIRFVGVEEGNEYCFKLDSRDGVIEAGNPDLTDGLIEEVEGKGEIEERETSERDWWEQPSQLQKGRMRHFRHWWHEARLGKAIADYPQYTPPHKGLAALRTVAQAEENFAYFLSQKDARIEALRGLLRKFGLHLAFDDGTKKVLDRWLHRYGSFLYVTETRPSFYTQDPAWNGARRSLNVILDLGVCLGEFAIRETPSISWGLDDFNRPKHGSIYKSFLRPSLISSRARRPGRFPWDVLGDLYGYCNAHCNESYFTDRGGPMHRSQHEAREFFSIRLRDIHLRALGEDARADEEFWTREIGKDALRALLNKAAGHSPG